MLPFYTNSVTFSPYYLIPHKKIDSDIIDALLIFDGHAMFKQFQLNDRLLKSLNTLNLSKPTLVQERAIPLAMQGKDLFITAQTGTGKTLSYIIPLLNYLIENTQPGKGLQALIILPTRELASQTLKVMQQIARYTFFESLLVTGGESLLNQAAKLRKNPDIIIGTPGRLVEHWKKKQFALDTLKILVLDETDRILDMGFGDNVNILIENCPTSRQTFLLSATKGNTALEALIRRVSPNAIELHINTESPHQSITQQVIFADNTAHKERLVEWLLANETYQKTIIFTNTRQQADQLSSTFNATQIKHSILHSDKTADERKQTIHQLQQKHKAILIATDVAARGLDIPLLDLVINFDIPTTKDEYTHRIGRTGRMNNLGHAISFVTPSDLKNYNAIKQNNTLTVRVIDPLIGKFQGNKKDTAHNEIANNDNKSKQLQKSSPKTDQPSKTKKHVSGIVSADGFAPLKRKK